MSGSKQDHYFTYFPALGEIQLLPDSGIHMTVPDYLFPVVKWLYRRLAHISNPVPNDLKKYLTLDGLYELFQEERSSDLCGVVNPETIAEAAVVLMKLGVAELQPARHLPKGTELPLRADFALVPKHHLPLINQLVWD